MTIPLTKKYFILLLVLTIIGGAVFVFPLLVCPYYIPSFAIPFIITIVFLILGFAKQNLKYIKIAQYCTLFLGTSYLIEGFYMFSLYFSFFIAFFSITALPLLLAFGFCVFGSVVINVFLFVMFTKVTYKLDLSNDVFKNIGFVMIIIGLILILLTPIFSVGTGIDFMKLKHISLVRLYFNGLFSKIFSFYFISVGALEYFFTGFVMCLQNWKKKKNKVDILEKLYRSICLALTVLSLVILFCSFSVITVDEKDLFTILFIDKYDIDSTSAIIMINIIIYVYILCFGAILSIILSIMVIFKNTPVLRKILGFINIVFAAVILSYIKPNDSLSSFITLPSILLIAIGLYNLFTYYKDTYKEINVKKILHTSLLSILILLLLISSYSNYYLGGPRINYSSSNFYNVFVVIYYSIFEFVNIVRLGALDFGLIPSSIILFLFIIGEIVLYKIVKKKIK